MKCCCGSGAFTTIASIIGVVGLGIGAYNVVTTGCPLGLCRHCQDEPAVVEKAPAAAPAPSAPAQADEHAPAPLTEHTEHTQTGDR